MRVNRRMLSEGRSRKAGGALGVAGVATCLALIATSGAGAAATDTFYLDAYAPGTTGSSSTQSSVVLTAGQHYEVVVQGTFSAWRGWPWFRCGKVEPAPIYRSPGRPDDPTGYEAEFLFARPALDKPTCGKNNLPRKSFIFQLNAGSGWADPTPVGGAPSKPNKTHTYTYDIVGTGAALGARIVDNETRDNSGRLRIEISPVSAT